MNGCNILKSFHAGLAQVSETRGVNQLRVLLLLALQLNVQQRERPAGPIRRPQPRPHQTQLDASQDAALVGRPATNPLHYPTMKSAAKPWYIHASTAETQTIPKQRSVPNCI